MHRRKPTSSTCNKQRLNKLRLRLSEQDICLSSMRRCSSLILHRLRDGKCFNYLISSFHFRVHEVAIEGKVKISRISLKKSPVSTPPTLTLSSPPSSPLLLGIMKNKEPRISHLPFRLLFFSEAGLFQGDGGLLIFVLIESLHELY